MNNAVLTPGRRLLLIGLAALFLSAFVQNHVEKRRVEANLVWTDPENKQTLEAGFMALGGFRGILADVLWVRAIAQQEAGRYYELKLICDMIQKLQPTFTNIHAFQARNMTYNLPAKSETCEDKWYWIRSGIEVLERGLARNKHNYALWHELAFTYMDRMGEKLLDKITGQDCTPLILSELPALDDLTEAQREKVFSHSELWKDSPRKPPEKNEHFRYAAYYFYRSLETKNNPSPLIDERNFGNCLDRLGYYRSKMDVPPEQRKWNDWGTEEWWVDVLRRNVARGVPNERTIPDHLRFTMIAEIGLCDTKIIAALAANRPDDAAKFKAEMADDYARFKTYFPQGTETLEALIKIYRDARRKQAGH